MTDHDDLLEILAAFGSELLAKAVAEASVKLLPGTVQEVIQGVNARVLLDGDTVPIETQNAASSTIEPGARVLVLFFPPHGAVIFGPVTVTAGDVTGLFSDWETYTPRVGAFYPSYIGSGDITPSGVFTELDYGAAVRSGRYRTLGPLTVWELAIDPITELSFEADDGGAFSFYDDDIVLFSLPTPNGMFPLDITNVAGSGFNVVSGYEWPAATVQLLGGGGSRWYSGANAQSAGFGVFAPPWPVDAADWVPDLANWCCVAYPNISAYFGDAIPLLPGDYGWVPWVFSDFANLNWDGVALTGAYVSE